VNFNQSQTIVGFATTSIYDVRQGNGAANKQILAKISTTLQTEWGEVSSGTPPDYGVHIPPTSGQVVQ